MVSKEGEEEQEQQGREKERLIEGERSVGNWVFNWGFSFICIS
jgi:hypothetical protein